LGPPPSHEAGAPMPKIRTHKGTKKRFRVTATGKVMRRHAFRSHLLEHKSSKRKRLYNKLHDVAPGDAENIKRNAPYL
ncbi:MAG TPA: 50S ribosomal protein L35, partial [Candidatus Sulfotelmatobacter sp.]|nr:50S ribosomal protein L35 [Candidatus Sulfotelmatobacter sp.]